MMDGDSFFIDFDPNKRFAFGREGSLITPPVINVYLAGSLTNIDPNAAEDCKAVRKIVRRVLESYDYLGIRFVVYDPADITSPGSNHSPEEVYELDHERTALADLVIFHVNTPSLGVGCETQIAADATLPKVTVCKRGVPVSRMYGGVFSPTVASIEYATHDELEQGVIARLPDIAAAAIESAERRRPIANAFTDLRLGRVILRQRILKNMSIAELAKLTDIREYWLTRIERRPDQAATCTLIQLARIAESLGCYLKIVGDRQLPTLVPSQSSLAPAVDESLNNLVSYCNSRQTSINDERLFRLWNSYSEEEEQQATEAIAHRGGEHQALTTDDWERRDRNLGLF